MEEQELQDLESRLDATARLVREIRELRDRLPAAREEGYNAAIVDDARKCWHEATVKKHHDTGWNAAIEAAAEQICADCRGGVTHALICDAEPILALKRPAKGGGEKP